jgi:hypothetical protein
VTNVHRIPAQRFVTIAKRPSLMGRDGQIASVDLPDNESGKFFEKGLDRFLQCEGDLPVGQHSHRTIEAQAGVT